MCVKTASVLHVQWLFSSTGSISCFGTCSPCSSAATAEIKLLWAVFVRGWLLGCIRIKHLGQFLVALIAARFGLGHSSHWHILVIDHVLLLVVFDEVLVSVSQTSPFWLCSVSSCRHKKVMLANLSKCSQSWLLEMCFLSLPSCRQPERQTSKEKLSKASN